MARTVDSIKAKDDIDWKVGTKRYPPEIPRKEVKLVDEAQVHY